MPGMNSKWFMLDIYRKPGANYVCVSEKNHPTLICSSDGVHIRGIYPVVNDDKVLRLHVCKGDLCFHLDIGDDGVHGLVRKYACDNDIDREVLTEFADACTVWYDKEKKKKEVTR